MSNRKGKARWGRINSQLAMILPFPLVRWELGKLDLLNLEAWNWLWLSIFISNCCSH
nr:hypothetical protein Q903MT_gene6381 [Picea sitchensis]